MGCFEDLKERALAVRSAVVAEQETLIRILVEQESHAVAAYEVEKSISSLQNLDKEAEYLGRNVRCISSYLPINLPLYSLIIFGVVPGLSCTELYVRPPVAIARTVSRLVGALNLGALLPNLLVSRSDRRVFQKDNVARSDVVVFTGKFHNAISVVRSCRKDALFLFNGSGVNPFIVGKNADSLETLVCKAIEVRTFNSGQDCAGPAAFLLHRSVYKQFADCLLDRLSGLKCGLYQDPEVKVGPLIQRESLIGLVTKMNKWSGDIIYGGQIDVKNGIVMPTVVVADLKSKWTYEEIFAPIFFVLIYDDEAELIDYFARSEYRDHAMYASVFGDVRCTEALKHTIILRGKTVLEVEDGNEPFGGYGPRASFAHVSGRTYYHPLLISREMSRYLPPAESDSRRCSAT